MSDISTIAAEMRKVVPLRTAGYCPFFGEHRIRDDTGSCDCRFDPRIRRPDELADALDAAAKEQQADKQLAGEVIDTLTDENARHGGTLLEQQGEIARLRREVEKLKADNATLDTVVGMMQDTLSLEPEEFSRVKQKTKETAEALRAAIAAGANQ